MSTDTITIPAPDSLRANIRTRTAELRALRRLLRLAEAAQAVDHARCDGDEADGHADDRQEADRA